MAQFNFPAYKDACLRGRPNCDPVNLCDGFDLSSALDTCTINNQVRESINIGGARIFVFKLLGIHEQRDATDLTGYGKAFSSTNQPDYGPEYAFDGSCHAWRSEERGEAVLTSHIGYDFGEILVSSGRNQYSVDTFVQYKVNVVRIKQSSSPERRASKIRVEYSLDGKVWKPSALVKLVNDGDSHVYEINSKVRARYWRFVPVSFNGTATNDFWEVDKIQIVDYDATHISNVQDDWGFIENRDRDYASTSVMIKGIFDGPQDNAYLAAMGIQLAVADTITVKMHFDDMVAKLGRPVVIGDVVEMPSLTEYTNQNKAVTRYYEVSDVRWDMQSFTPGWVPTIMKVDITPMMASQETRDIVGGIKSPVEAGDEFVPFFNQTAFMADDKIGATSNELVPELGEDISSIPVIDKQSIDTAASMGADLTKLVKNDNLGAYTKSALPPNGEPYTEGDEYPKDPKDRAWHRLTYTSTDPTIPARLYVYSLKKRKWIFMEEDERAYHNRNSNATNRFLNSKQRVSLKEVK